MCASERTCVPKKTHVYTRTHVRDAKYGKQQQVATCGNNHQGVAFQANDSLGFCGLDENTNNIKNNKQK